MCVFASVCEFVCVFACVCLCLYVCVMFTVYVYFLEFDITF